MDLLTFAVEGFCKLFMNGHMRSARLFAQLVLLNFNPRTLNFKKLRACLACFLSQYAYLRGLNQICVEEAFMYSVRRLLSSQADAYVKRIDLNKVVELMLNMTNYDKFIKKQTNQRQKVCLIVFHFSFLF